MRRRKVLVIFWVHHHWLKLRVGIGLPKGPTSINRLHGVWKMVGSELAKSKMAGRHCHFWVALIAVIVGWILGVDVKVFPSTEELAHVATRKTSGAMLHEIGGQVWTGKSAGILPMAIRRRYLL